jgi:hypothetical protein
LAVAAFVMLRAIALNDDGTLADRRVDFQKPFQHLQFFRITVRDQCCLSATAGNGASRRTFGDSIDTRRPGWI